MIFSEPMTALNPVYTIGEQLAEPIMKHLKMTREQADKRSADLIERMGLKLQRCFYVIHQLWGRRQRIMIAMAITCKPKLLIGRTDYGLSYNSSANISTHA
jgi:ABC-type microcin C transport system duplicated ATPase subunit YejF